LTTDPGSRFEHGGVAVALLGQVMAARAGTNFEALLIDRILQPLDMSSTRFNLTPELRSRLAVEHLPSGKARPAMAWGVLAPLAGLRSTANDLLKFVSVNLGLTQSRLTPLLNKHVTNFPWWTVPAEENHAIVQFGGGGMYNTAYCGFDRSHRRGLVVLSTSDDGRYNALAIGRFLLEACDWRAESRPRTNPANWDYSAFVGQYETKTDSSSLPSKIDVRQLGDRLFVQVDGARTHPIDLMLPPGSGELLPQSQAAFFERLSGTSVTFSFIRTNVTGLILRHGERVVSYAKISDGTAKSTQ
jgi:D-alanyl-D-alanine-carboxypeptidase/D-alanyl-D-alanine-endopeptidase